MLYTMESHALYNGEPCSIQWRAMLVCSRAMLYFWLRVCVFGVWSPTHPDQTHWLQHKTNRIPSHKRFLLTISRQNERSMGGGAAASWLRAAWAGPQVRSNHDAASWAPSRRCTSHMDSPSLDCSHAHRWFTTTVAVGAAQRTDGRSAATVTKLAASGTRRVTLRRARWSCLLPVPPRGPWRTTCPRSRCGK